MPTATKFLTNHGHHYGSDREQRARTDSLLEQFCERVQGIRSELRGSRDRESKEQEHQRDTQNRPNRR